jgi:RNA polymerase sigma factor (sigma-70 family)
MSLEGEGSVTLCIGDLKTGGDGAAQFLWERYFDRLVRLARASLRTTPHRGAVEDEEDAALSAFDSFCQGVAKGRFPRLGDRDDLWRLLVVITRRKVLDQLRRQSAGKRDARRVVSESALTGEDAEGDGGLDHITGPEPTPEFAAMVAEESRRLLDRLQDETLRQVAIWRMEGYTDDEVAARLGCSRSSVQRKLSRIRQLWSDGELR